MITNVRLLSKDGYKYDGLFGIWNLEFDVEICFVDESMSLA